MSTDIAFPDPQSMTAAQVKSDLPARAHEWRKSIEEAGDADRAVELHRQLEALRTYLADREAAEIVEAESRRTEVLIGKLLGEPVVGRPVDENPPSWRVLSDADKGRFRALAAHAETIEVLITEGIVKRAALLRAIDAIPTPVYGGPVYFGKGDKWQEVIQPLQRYLAAWEKQGFRFGHINPREAGKRVQVIDSLFGQLTAARADLEPRSHKAKLTV